MARIYQVKDPSNNALNDIPLEDNAVLLSGYCSDVGTISNGKLFAYDGFTLQALYTSNGFTSELMPIGAHIYAYMGFSYLTDTDVNSLKAYDSYYEVPLSDNGVVIGSQTFTRDFGNYDAVWLEVNLDSSHTHWYPVGITGSTGLQPKGLYIYLGGYTGDVESQNQSDIDKFMLETKNELYYYDSTLGMIPFNLWELDQQVGWIEAQLAAI